MEPRAAEAGTMLELAVLAARTKAIVSQGGEFERLSFVPVSEARENHVLWPTTPNAAITFPNLTNRTSFGKISEGEEYLVLIVPASEVEAGK